MPAKRTTGQQGKDKAKPEAKAKSMPQKKRSQTRRGRNKRKTERTERRAAEMKQATPLEQVGGGWRVAGKDTGLVTRAVSENWPVTPDVKQRAVTAMEAIIATGDVKPDTKVNAASALIRMDQANIAREKAETPQAHQHLHLHTTPEALHSAIDELRRDGTIEAHRRAAIARSLDTGDAGDNRDILDTRPVADGPAHRPG